MRGALYVRYVQYGSWMTATLLWHPFAWGQRASSALETATATTSCYR